MGGIYKVANKYFSVEIDSSGRIRSMIHHSTANQVVVPQQFGNQLVLFDDIPLYWDAWDCMDYHLETRSPVNHSASTEEEVHVESANHLKVTLKWSQPIGQHSHIHQKIHVTAVDSFIEFETRVQWAENRKFLKVEFPVEVHTHQARIVVSESDIYPYLKISTLYFGGFLPSGLVRYSVWIFESTQP